MAEQARRSIGSLFDSVENLSVSTFSFADDTCSVVNSFDLNGSVFTTESLERDSSEQESELMDITRSVTDSINNLNQLAETVEQDTPLSRAYNISQKRFERVIGNSNIASDVIKLDSVSCLS